MPTSFLFLVGIGLVALVIGLSYWHEWRVTKEKQPEGEMWTGPYGPVHGILRGSEQDARKSPIVLIHGSTTNGLDMDIDLAGKLEDERQVFIPDRTGHGFSPRVEKGWRLDVQAAQIRAAVREAGLEKPIILGQSYGGAVALRYAMDYPEEIAGVVLVAAVTQPWPGGVSWYNRVGINPYYGWLFRRTFIPLYARYASKRGVEKALRGSPHLSRYYARTRVPLTFRPRSFLANNEDIVRLYEQLYAMQGRYKDLSMPIEALAGTHDMTVVTSVHARKMEEVVSSLNLDVIDTGGHALHHTHGERVLAAINRLDERLANEGRSPLQGALRAITSVFPSSA